MEYFKSKDNLSQKYKLMNDSILQVLDDKGLEIELVFVKNLLTNEEEYIKSILVKSKGIKQASLDPSLPLYLVLKSWGLSFGIKLQTLALPESKFDMKEALLRDVDNFLN